MRVCNTKYIIDKDRPLVYDLYTERVRKPLADLLPTDIDQGNVMRALAELRLYHLPPYFDVPTKVKGRIQNAGCLLYDAESATTSARVERELIAEHSAIFAGIAPISRCPRCGEKKKLTEHGVCAECKILELERAVDGKTWEEIRRWPLDTDWSPLAASVDSLAQLKLEYRRSLKPRLSDPYVPWTSPKKVLLAAELGCMICKHKHTVEWLWSDDLSGWSDGTCPSCKSSGLWSIDHSKGPRWYRRTNTMSSYDRCAMCNSTEHEYALWGMCHECYANWQLSYYDRPEQLAFHYGALATLLVWPSAEWVKHLRQRLPSSYIRRSMGPAAYLEEFIPRNPHIKKSKQPRSIEEAGVDLDAILRSKLC